MRNNESTKQRKYKKRSTIKGLRNNDTTKQRKNDAKLGMCDAKDRDYETTKLQNNERVMRNSEKSDAKQRKGDVKQRICETNNETAKQRECEMARCSYLYTIYLSVILEVNFLQLILQRYGPNCQS